jgi:hypothetical protein
LNDGVSIIFLMASQTTSLTIGATKRLLRRFLRPWLGSLVAVVQHDTATLHATTQPVTAIAMVTVVIHSPLRQCSTTTISMRAKYSSSSRSASMRAIRPSLAFCMKLKTISHACALLMSCLWRLSQRLCHYAFSPSVPSLFVGISEQQPQTKRKQCLCVLCACSLA